MLSRWDNINTLEEFQRFIDDNDIKNPTKFKKNNFQDYIVD